MFCLSSFIHFGMGPKKGPDGTPAITLPMGDKKLPGIAVEDIGKCAYGILRRGHEWIGKTIGIAGEHLTGAEMAAAFTRALGREVRYKDVSPEVYRSLGSLELMILATCSSSSVTSMRASAALATLTAPVN